MLNDFERYGLRNVVRTKGSFAGPSSSILRFDKRKAKISQMMSLTALLTFSNLLAVSRLEFLHLVSGTGLISYLAIELFWRKVFSRINFLQASLNKRSVIFHERPNYDAVKKFQNHLGRTCAWANNVDFCIILFTHKKFMKIYSIETDKRVSRFTYIFFCLVY